MEKTPVKTMKSEFYSFRKSLCFLLRVVHRGPVDHLPLCPDDGSATAGSHWESVRKRITRCVLLYYLSGVLRFYLSSTEMGLQHGSVYRGFKPACAMQVQECLNSSRRSRGSTVMEVMLGF